MAQWNRPTGRPFNSKPILNGHMMESNRPPPLMSHYCHDEPMMVLSESQAPAPLPRQPPPPQITTTRRRVEINDNFYEYDHRPPPPLIPPDDYYDDDNPPPPLPDNIPPSHMHRQEPPAFNDYPEAPPPIIHTDRPIRRYLPDDIAVYDHLPKYPHHMDNPHPHHRPMIRHTRPDVNRPISPQYDDYDYPPFNHGQCPQPSIHHDEYDEERMMPSYHHPIPPSPQPLPPSGPYGRSPNLGHPRPRPPLPHSSYPPATSTDWPAPPRHQPPLPPLPPPQQPPLPPSLPPPVHIPIGSNLKKHHSAPDIVTIDSLLLPPTRTNRASQIVIIIRGLPGSGKTHLAKLIKEKEIANGGNPPRILSLDDYFLTEVEKSIKDPNTGKITKTKVTEYTYEKEMEDMYRASLFKSFCRTVDEGFFPFIMVDAIHNRVSQFLNMWQHAKKKDFEVYVAEITADAHECSTRSTHGRTEEEIEQILASWEETPEHIKRVDVRSLLQDAVINEVEMDCGDSGSNDDTVSHDNVSKETQESYTKKCRWEEMDKKDLDLLDGVSSSSSSKRKLSRDGDDEEPLLSEKDLTGFVNNSVSGSSGKKRVRWADIEEESERKHRRQIGFVIGTDWKDLTPNDSEVNKLSGSQY